MPPGERKIIIFKSAENGKEYVTIPWRVRVNIYTHIYIYIYTIYPKRAHDGSIGRLYIYLHLVGFFTVYGKWISIYIYI